jgi:hypothetical protein
MPGLTVPRRSVERINMKDDANPAVSDTVRADVGRRTVETVCRRLGIRSVSVDIANSEVRRDSAAPERKP